MKQFDKVATVYAKVRPGYPTEVYNTILEWNEGKIYSRAADIGCGAGHSVKGLLDICEEVVGVEPGDNLRLAAQVSYPTCQFYAGSGEETGLDTSSVDLVTVATAFYWMDREKAIREFNRILLPGGKVALYRYRFPVVESPANEAVVAHCTKFWDRFREERLVREDDSDALLKASGFFDEVKTCKVRNIWKLSIDDFVGFLSSTSYVSRHLETLGEGAETYLEGFANELRALNDSEILHVNFDIHMILAKKHADA